MASGLSEALLRERGESGLSQEKVAQRIDVTRQTYVSWERGETEPRFSNLVALSSVWGKPLNAWLPEEEVKV